jgi:hypothetical protein
LNPITSGILVEWLGGKKSKWALRFADWGLKQLHVPFRER